MTACKRFRILYVASIHEDCLLLQAAVGTGRVDVTFVDSAADAMKELEGARFDLCLLETRLTDGSGFDLCRRIRGLGLDLPVIFYTGDAGEIYRSMGFAAGADAYLAKPYFDSLTSKLGEYIHPVPEIDRPRPAAGVSDECRLMERPSH